MATGTSLASAIAVLGIVADTDRALIRGEAIMDPSSDGVIATG